MSAFFVTATGTDIGKTYVSAALLRFWRALGRDVFACKPVMSGFGEHELAQSDAGQLLRAMGREATPEAVSEICLHRFEPALAPNHAMRLDGVEQDFDAISRFAQNCLSASADTITLVEGAGGVMSPITDDALNLGLICALNIPVVLVSAGYLGAVSHTLSAIKVLRQADVKIAALAVSQPAPEAENPDHLIAEIARFEQVPSYAIRYGDDVSALASALLNGSA